MALKRYWFEFDSPSFGIFRYGCGVTGYNREDALTLLNEHIGRLFNSETLPPIKRVIEDIDISTLDANHILPNMGVSVRRGVWYPNLNS